MADIAINEVKKNGDKKIYWSPSVFWEVVDNKLKIEVFLYDEFAMNLFPKFFFLTQKGILVNDLVKEFPEVDQKRLSLLIKDLIKKRIIISDLLTPQDVFFPQSRLFKAEYGDELLYDAHELKTFKKKQLNRTFEVGIDKKIYFDDNFQFPENITDRRSYRKFDVKDKISFDDFSKMISIFKQIKSENETRYYYASAGGLYPIDVFLYIKKDRIENVNQGIYYYNPSENCIQLVNDHSVISEEAHLFFNKDIFKSSAFSVYLIYNADANMPKYKSDGYFYACLDAGIMISTLTQAAELVNIGLCSIGEMSFKKIERYFKLNERQVYLHTIEGGSKPLE